MTNEIIKLDVPNAPAIPVINEYVALRSLCESIGLDFQAQARRLARVGEATIAMMATVASDGKTREMFCIHKDDFRVWLAGIDTSRVKSEQAKKRILTYKREVKQVLKDYYEKGKAENPRFVTDPFKRAELLRMYKGLLPDDRIAKRAEIDYARAIGEAPEIPQEEMPLYVETYLDEKGRPDISSSGFGRKLANLFRNTTGQEPPVEPALIHGRMRNAKAYKESHRPLFDQVLATYAAK